MEQFVVKSTVIIEGDTMKVKTSIDGDCMLKPALLTRAYLLIGGNINNMIKENWGGNKDE